MSTQRRPESHFRCGVVFFAALLLVTTCTKTPEPVSSADAVLRIGVPEDVSGNEFGIRNIASNISFEGLAELSPDGRAFPKLAETWQWSANGLQLEVTLRKGVTFHDGTPLTAPLAAEILRRAMPRPQNRALYPSLADVVDVSPGDNLRLMFKLAQPSAFLPEDLELPLEIGNPAVGTGPYKIVKRDPSEIVMEANPKYYLGQPQIARVILRPFPALRTAWSSLLRGELDTVTNVPPEAVEFVSNDDVQVVSFGRRYQHVIAFNSGKPPFNNPVVRRALNAAINREDLVKKVLQGRGTPSTGPIWPQHWAYDSSLSTFNFDPALATSLLENSGYHEREGQGPRARLRFVCLVPMNFAVSERIGLEVQKQLYDVGVDMQFEVVRVEELDARIRSGRYDAVLLDLLSGPTLGRAYMFWASPKSLKGLNLFGYENPEMERLFALLRTTTNEAAIRSATRSLQRVLLEDPPALFLAWNQRSRAVRRNFKIVHDDARDPADPLYTIWRWTQVSPTLTP